MLKPADPNAADVSTFVAAVTVVTALRSMNPRPNITSYPVCIEDGGRNGGKSGFG